MGEVLLLLVVALTVAAVVFGVTVLVSGRDPGLVPAEPDGRAVPLPATRPLQETDVAEVRFDTALRGYRMAQVDQAMRRAAYDIGYKAELIGVLEAEVLALREGRTEDADALRRAREEAAGVGTTTAPGLPPEVSDETAPTAAEAPEADAAPSTADAADDQPTAPTEDVALRPPADPAPGVEPTTERAGTTATGEAGPGDAAASRDVDGDDERALERGAVVRSESA